MYLELCKIVIVFLRLLTTGVEVKSAVARVAEAWKSGGL